MRIAIKGRNHSGRHCRSQDRMRGGAQSQRQLDATGCGGMYLDGILVLFHVARPVAESQTTGWRWFVSLREQKGHTRLATREGALTRTRGRPVLSTQPGILPMFVAQSRERGIEEREGRG